MALVHPQFDPVAVPLGHWHIFGHDFAPAIHWYGLTYMVAFGLFVWLAGRRAQYPWFAREGWVRRDVEDLLFYGVLGVVLGGRLGYVIFYKPLYYADHLREIVAVWNGGMSFHGGMLGVIVAMAFFAWQRKRPFLQVTDLIAPCVPLGLASGRVGNFINGELWGRVTDPSAPWAMLFPGAAPDDAAWLTAHPQLAAQWHLNEVFAQYHMLPRHPSELYEIALEGVALFFVLFFFSRKPKPMGAISAVFLIGYGLARFTVEFAREPDDFLGLLAMGLSMGQWLSLPMILVGIGILVWSYRRARREPAQAVSAN
jgi:phosphatidylglycerol:prolipoprotein diacylglycerol transferase